MQKDQRISSSIVVRIYQLAWNLRSETCKRWTPVVTKKAPREQEESCSYLMC